MTLVITKEQLQKEKWKKICRANPTMAEGGDSQHCPTKPIAARLPLGTSGHSAHRGCCERGNPPSARGEPPWAVNILSHVKQSRADEKSQGVSAQLTLGA